jgi:hypothetical protein
LLRLIVEPERGAEVRRLRARSRQVRSPFRKPL